jgi:hypothetical protein
MNFFKNKQILIAILVTILLVILYSYFSFINRNPSSPPIIPVQKTITITTAPIKGDLPKVLNINQVPTLRPDQGQGVDITSQIAQNSTGQINVIEKELTYEDTIKTSNGQEVTIVIPRKDLQANPWTLTVYTHGVNFNAPKNSKEYNTMKTAYLESVAHVFTWLRSKGVQPEQVIFQWGDKRYIQDRAEEWLRE